MNNVSRNDFLDNMMEVRRKGQAASDDEAALSK
jgi:hypothetical protein